MRTFVFCVACSVNLTALAGPQVFRGHDNNLMGSIPLVNTPNSNAARSAFLDIIGQPTFVQDFESLANGAIPATIGFGPDLSAAAVGGPRANIRNTSTNGAFGTLGSRYLYAEPAENELAFSLTFSRSIRAIGFTHTDASDWFNAGQNPPSLIVRLGDGQSTMDIDLTDVVLSTVRNASVGFFGVVLDSGFTEFSIVRPVGGGTTDALGVDGIIVLVPAPASAALLLGLPLFSRRRR